MSKTNETTETTEYVAVRNDAARMFALSYFVENVSPAGAGVMIREKRFQTIRLLPGLNYVTRAEFDKCILAHECADGTVAGYEFLEVIEPTGMSLSQAKTLIAATKNRQPMTI